MNAKLLKKDLKATRKVILKLRKAANKQRDLAMQLQEIGQDKLSEDVSSIVMQLNESAGKLSLEYEQLIEGLKRD